MVSRWTWYWSVVGRSDEGYALMDLGARGRIQGEDGEELALFYNGAAGCGSRAAHACEERGAEACPGRFFCRASGPLPLSLFIYVRVTATLTLQFLWYYAKHVLEM